MLEEDTACKIEQYGAGSHPFGERYKWFTHGPADATASSFCLLDPNPKKLVDT